MIGGCVVCCETRLGHNHPGVTAFIRCLRPVITFKSKWRLNESASKDLLRSIQQHTDRASNHA
jgi:hypothetical protein